MKKLLQVLILFGFQSYLSQVNVFIGKTKKQVNDFWSVKVSNRYFLETGPEEFVIMSESSGVPLFQADFDGKGKCYSHFTQITYDQISVMYSRLKQEGYKFDTIKRVHVAPDRKHFARIYQPNLRAYILKFDLYKNVDSIIKAEIDYNKVLAAAIERSKSKDTIVKRSPDPIPAQKEKDTREIFTVVENGPEFPGGLSEMVKFIQKNIKHPDPGIGGKCFTKFVVNSNGEISDLEVLKGVSGCPDCDKEAVRVIKLMPKWKPATVYKKPVNAYHHLPISFKSD